MIEPHLPQGQPGARRVDDRRVISGMLHVDQVGLPLVRCAARLVRHYGKRARALTVARDAARQMAGGKIVQLPAENAPATHEKVKEFNAW